MTLLQKTAVTAVFAVIVGTAVYEARQAAHVRAELDLLREQQRPLNDQLTKSIQERDDARRQLTSLRDANEYLSRNAGELLKLRGEVARYRQSWKEIETAKQATNQSDTPQSGRVEWKPAELKNAGLAMPKDALQTYLWAGANMNTAELTGCVVPNAADPPSDEAVQSWIMNPMNHDLNGFQNFKILSQSNINTDEVQLELQANVDGGGYSRTLTLRNVSGEWRIVLFTSRDADGKARGAALSPDKNQSTP